MATHPQGDQPPRKAVDTRLTISVSPREGFEFVMKLATDDEFRARFEADPEGVLRQSGVVVAPGSISYGAKFKLADKSVFREIAKKLAMRDPLMMPLVGYKYPLCPTWYALIPFLMLEHLEEEGS